MNSIDEMNIAKSLRSLMMSGTDTSDMELGKLKDRIFHADLREKLRKKEPIPGYLHNHCRICTTFQDIVSTDKGPICIGCQSTIDERSVVYPEKVSCYVTILDAGAVPIKKHGKINVPTIGEIASIYTKIAKAAGYNHWMMDPKGQIVGGYYYKDGGERIILTRDEIHPKPKPVIRPIRN